MLTERPFYTLGRLPEWTIWMFFTLAMTSIVRLVVPSWGWFGLAYFPLFFFLGALSNSEPATGFLAARRGTIAVTCVVLSVVISLALIRWYPANNSSSYLTMGRGLQPRLIYAMIGTILGALLRNGVSLLINLALLGKKRLGQNVLMTALWSVGILFFPWEGHRDAAPFYVAGIGLGVILSRSFRLRVSKAAEAFWRIQEVSESFPKGANISEIERESLRLLAQGRELPFFRYTTLRKRLEEWRGSKAFTTRVSLISCNVFRLEGNHLAAIAESEVAPESPQLLEEAHLILLRALSLFEVGRDEEADAVLKSLLQTEIGKKCPLAAATQALQLAFEASADPDRVERTSEPLDWLWIALNRRHDVIVGHLSSDEPKNGEKRVEDPVDRFIAKFTEVGIPLSIPYYLDILGFCLVTAGYPEEGRIFLDRCIELDRTFSQSYLHLGDYFLLRGRLSGIRRRRKHDLWHAKACYHAALFLEPKSGSRVRRIGVKRIDHIKQEEKRTGSG